MLWSLLYSTFSEMKAQSKTREILRQAQDKYISGNRLPLLDTFRTIDWKGIKEELEDFLIKVPVFGRCYNLLYYSEVIVK